MAAGNASYNLDILNGNTSYEWTGWEFFTVPALKKLEYFFVFSIFVVGVIGNFLSFTIFSRSTFRQFSYAAYFRYLAIFDSLNLLVEFVTKLDELRVQTAGSSFLTQHNDVTCKLSELIRPTFILMSSWLTAAFSLDRVVAVISPFRKYRFCTTGTAKVVTLMMLALSAASQSFRLVLIHADAELPEVGMSPCIADRNHQDAYFLADYFIFDFGLRFLLPFGIIVVSNSLVLSALRRQETWTIQSSGGRFMPHRKNVRQTRLAKTALYLVSTFFVLTMSPAAILQMTWYVNNWKGNIEMYIKLLPFQAPFVTYRLTNYSLNFFLYCFSFRSFRRELKVWKCRSVSFVKCSGKESLSSKETETWKQTKSPTC